MFTYADIHIKKSIKMSPEVISATVKTNRFNKHSLKHFLFQTQTQQSCISKVSFLPCLDYVPNEDRHNTQGVLAT